MKGSRPVREAELWERHTDIETNKQTNKQTKPVFVAFYFQKSMS